MSTNSPELIIVMPVFNEQASVRKVVMEWFQEVENWTENFVFLAIDDGSKDESLQVLKRLQSQLGSRIEILSRENRGHGQSCLQGYREAIARGIPWIMQIDSDGQCDPQYFFRMWRLRKDKDVIYGRRSSRDDGWRRVIASHVLRLTLLLTCAVYCVDSNVPYRLLRSDVLKNHLDKIPPDFSLANIALAVSLRRDPEVREGKIRIHFRERYGGEPSVRLAKFGGKATELVRQLWALDAARAKKDAV